MSAIIAKHHSQTVLLWKCAPMASNSNCAPDVMNWPYCRRSEENRFRSIGVEAKSIIAYARTVVVGWSKAIPNNEI
jgi:hypothetical protein